LPKVVGYTWFKWYSGKDLDTPDVGVVTDELEVNRVSAGMFRRMNPFLEEVHCGAIAPDAV
jgi:hypothetical protein